MFAVQVISPESVTYTGEAVRVIARTVGGGDIAFDAGHVPFIGALAVWSVDVVKPSGDRDVFAVHRGFVQVSGNQVTILSDVSEAAEQINVARANAALARAEAALGVDDSAKTAKDRARVTYPRGSRVRRGE